MKTNRDIEIIENRIESNKKYIKWTITKLNEDLTKEDYDFWFEGLCFWVNFLKENEKDLEYERNKENWYNEK